MTAHAEVDGEQVDNLELVLNWPQTQALNALRPDHSIVLAWGRGVGKSFQLRVTWFILVALAEASDEVFEQLADGYELDASLVAAFRKVRRRKKPGIRIVVLGPTRKQLVDIHGADVRHDLEQGDWAWLGGVINRTVWSIEFPGGSTIRFLGMDGSVRGVRADVLTPDECDDILISQYDAVAAPLLSATWSLGIEVFGGTPIRGRFGLLYRQYTLGKTSEHVTSIHATYRDVPETVKASTVEKERERVTLAIFKREWECDFDAGEGLVFDLFTAKPFDPQTGHGHLLTPRTDAVPSEILVGVDWGYRHPGAMVEAHVFGKGEDADIFVVREFYKSEKTDEYWQGVARQIHSEARARFGVSPTFYADPSQPARIEELSVASNVYVLPAANSVEEGIMCVANRMFPTVHNLPCSFHAKRGGELDLECDACRTYRRPRLFVSPSCVNLVREMGLYRRKRDTKDKDRFHDTVEKVNDDACDALRYLVFSRFGKPVAPLRMGQEAVTN